jgi:pimeloyl-ACP methyl ester carboxylesterase
MSALDFDPGREPDSIRRDYVDVAEGQVHYRRTRETPESHDPVVLFHQAPSSSWMYIPVLDRLAGTHDAVALDMPGFGNSFCPESVPDIEFFAEIMRRAIEELGVNDLHLVGHHTGASAAVEFARGYPERVTSLSLVGPPSIPENDRGERLERLERKSIVPPIDSDGNYLVEQWHFFDDEGDDLELQHHLLMDALRARDVWVDCYRAVYTMDFDRAFEEVSAPRMVLASRGDVLWEGLVRLRDAHPDVRTVELDGGNYEPLLDAETFTDALTSFVATAEGDD